MAIDEGGEQDNLVEMVFPANVDAQQFDPNEIIPRQVLEADLLDALFEIGVPDPDLMHMAALLRAAGKNHVGKPLTVIVFDTDPENPLADIRLGTYLATTLWLKNPGVIDRGI